MEQNKRFFFSSIPVPWIFLGTMYEFHARIQKLAILGINELIAFLPVFMGYCVKSIFICITSTHPSLPKHPNAELHFFWRKWPVINSGIVKIKITCIGIFLFIILSQKFSKLWQITSCMQELRMIYSQPVLNTLEVSCHPSTYLCISSYLWSAFPCHQMLLPGHTEQMQWWSYNSPHGAHGDSWQNFHRCLIKIHSNNHLLN